MSLSSAPTGAGAETARQPQCLPDKERAITEAFACEQSRITNNPPDQLRSRGFRASMGLSFNLNVQPGLKFHSEVVLPDDDPLKPALYQGLAEGF